MNSKRFLSPLYWSLLCIAVVLGACNESRTSEPVFRKDGTLQFLRKPATGDSMIVLTEIDIEVADDPLEQSQGLKYRSSMQDSQGMLFVFPLERQQSFWMQDTKIPLDIIFVNESLKIVHIAAQTVPYSEEPIPSKRPARYVVEVIGGYCNAHDIQTGDLIQTRPN